MYEKSKIFIFNSCVVFCLSACGKSATDTLLNYNTSENKGIQTLQLDDKIFVPFTVVTPADCGNQIGFVGNDSKDKINES